MLWIVDGGVSGLQVTAFEAMLLKLCSEALKGNRRAQSADPAVTSSSWRG
jgi:hypothetical protein